MIERPSTPTLPEPAQPSDWLERVLVENAREAAAAYIDDAGFTAKVMSRLPVPVTLPKWRKPAVVMLWGIAGLGLAAAAPGVALDVAREAFKLFAAKPFSLSEIAAVLAVLGMGTWTTVIVAWKRV